MEKSVLVPIAHGSEELETVTIIDLLRRADIKVTVAGENDMVTFSRGVRIIPDILLSEVPEYENFGAIVLPGGGQGVDNFLEDDHLLEIVKYNIRKNNLICAICAAPLFLTHHKLIDESVMITSFPDMGEELNHKNYSEDDVVVSGNFITSRGPGTAINFTLKIIETMTDMKTVRRVAKEMCYKY
ncbi:MAG: DJ-1 family protein [Ignavibacteriae bacterium HGW-Ignavibacteriae-4]|jgi:4-methyl-5(b-hydroxyethyl)-thiazole monophosphate biosynthesis|nr:MAG: DJ-1 family protein [Ignavibacteriae bacterium HGW-Ignavibacteriae-4]